MTKVTDKDIREHLGHGIGNRRVRITRDGTVEYYGSTNEYDRGADYWAYYGTRDEIERNLRLQFD